MARSTTRFGTHGAFKATAALLVLLAACSPDASAPSRGQAMDREVFIATYVDLRATVVRGDEHELSDEARATVLARHGVTEEQLLAFAEVHGEDVVFMRGVWDEVEARMDALRVLPGADERR